MNALEYAVNMELDGEKYYLEQAKLNFNNSLKTVCRLLAQEERYHAELLTKNIIDLEYELLDSDAFMKIKNIFNDIGNFKSDIKATPSQLDFYRSALEKEQQSINLYKDLLSKATDKKEQELFEFLISQENNHFSLIDELVHMLRRADEWVESAEFGLRIEEY